MLTNEELCGEALRRTKKNSLLDVIISLPFQLIATSIIYYLGWSKSNPAWLLCPVIISTIRDTWKLEGDLEKHIKMAMSLQHDFSYLPANKLIPWTVYPDVDQCETVNKLLANLWPTVTHFLTDMIKHEVETKIKEQFHYFRFECVNFGDEPPQITGVKVYEHNSNRNEIMMDVSLFYGGDCDFQISLFGLRSGIQHLQVHGLIRIIIKPLLKTQPICGGLEIMFLRKPEIDFNLVGLVQLTSIAGLKRLILNSIDDKISSTIVFPNKIYISLVNNSSSIKTNYHEPLGVLKVNVVDAIDLVAMKATGLFGQGNVDPYVKINFGKHMFQSIKVEEPLSPEWNFWSEYLINFPDDETLLVTVYKEESSIGEVSLKLKTIKEAKYMDIWLELQNTESGEIHLKLYYCELTSDLKDYKDSLAKCPYLSSSVFMVHIDSAQNLSNPNSRQEPNVEVSVLLGNQKSVLNTIVASNNPIFQETVTFLVVNPGTERLEMEFRDNSKTTKVVMGIFSFHVWQLLYVKGMEIINQRYPLFDSVSGASVVVSMKLKIIVRKDY